MPREQRTKLKQGPVVETTRGEFGSKVVQPVDFAAEIAPESAGEKLAKSLSMVTKGLTNIYTDYQKGQETEEIIEWSRYGDEKGREALAEMNNLPLEEREAFLKSKLTGFMEEFKTRTEGRGVSQGGFRAGLGAMSDYVTRGEDAILKEKLKIDLEKKMQGIEIHVKTLYNQGKTPKQIMEFLSENKSVYFTKQDVTKDYARMVANMANEMILNNPQMDIEPFIDDYLNVETLDGLKMYSIKDVKNTIDDIRNNSLKSKNYYYATTLDNKLADINENEVRNYTQIEKDLNNNVINSEVAEKLKTAVDNNITDFQNTNRDNLYDGIQNGTVTQKDVDKARKEERISVAQHNALSNEINSKVEKTKSALVYKEIYGKFDTDLSFENYVKVLSETGADDQIKYNPTQVQKAYKQAVNNRFNSIASKGFQAADMQSLKEVFKAAGGNVKIEQFDIMINDTFTTGLGDIMNQEGDAATKGRAAIELVNQMKAFVKTSTDNGYMPKNLNNFYKEAYSVIAEINVDPLGGLEAYMTGKNLNKVAPANQKAIFESMLANTELHDPEDEDEVPLASYLFRNFRDMYNVIYTRTGSHEEAASAVGSFITSNYVKVDIQGSGLVDDEMWVKRMTGIQDQEGFDKVTGVLGEYFGMDDDLQLYSTDPIDEKAPWIFRDALGTAYKVPSDIIRGLGLWNPQDVDKKFQTIIDAGYPAVFEKKNLRQNISEE